MHPWITNEDDSRISFWQRVREYAVPPSMIETATVRRSVGDWAGACAAAGFDVDVDLPALACTRGRELAARVRADLLHLAPDLLRWHMPRVAPDGLLRPGLTVTLSRYGPEHGNRWGRASPVHLVVRTAPAWADSGQRMSLALWDESCPQAGTGLHPHPRPDRRFRLDLHRHLWEARRSGELRMRSGTRQVTDQQVEPALGELVAQGCAVDRWAAESELLLHADGCPPGPVLVRIGARRRVIVECGDTDPVVRIARSCPRATTAALPVLPHAATWMPPDLALLRAGAITVDRLHPLVAAAFVPGAAPAVDSHTSDAGPHLVRCRGGAAPHRTGERGAGRAGPQPGRDPAGGTAHRPVRHATALSAGDRSGAPASGLPCRSAGTADPR
ncbi:hypothetical protein [Nocardia nova]|uniref:hypothetical protein n=1 Tax=Nocardia nova TaxID=37330 RepID=UPI0004BA346D